MQKRHFAERVHAHHAWKLSQAIDNPCHRFWVASIIMQSSALLHDPGGVNEAERMLQEVEGLLPTHALYDINQLQLKGRTRGLMGYQDGVDWMIAALDKYDRVKAVDPNPRLEVRLTKNLLEITRVLSVSSAAMVEQGDAALTLARLHLFRRYEMEIASLLAWHMARSSVHYSM